jgi:hypothetical protein
LELVLQLVVPELLELYQVNEQQVVFALVQKVLEQLVLVLQERLVLQEQRVNKKYLEELQALELGEFHPLEN